MDRLREDLQNGFEDATRSIYRIIDLFEFISLRLIFWILHITSVYFNVKLFNNIAFIYYGEDFDKFIMGLCQLVGFAINMSLSHMSGKKQPYHQIFFATSSMLFTFGGFIVITNLPDINPIARIIVYFIFSGMSLGMIAFFKHKFDLNLDE